MIETPAANEGPKRNAWSALCGWLEVRPHEYGPLAASMLWIFLALTAYYVIKPLRSAVLQEKVGVDNKWLALVLTTVFVGLFAFVYGRIAPRIPRDRLVQGTFIAFALCLVGFMFALPRGGAVAGYAFYIWVSTFNLMIVSQFWSLAADVWSREAGLRVFGVIGIGGVAGGIFGTLVVSGLARSLSTEGMLALAGALLLVCMLLARFVLRFGASQRVQASQPRVPASEAPSEVNATNSLLLVLRSPYLRHIALMMLLLNLVNTSNEWILDKMVSRAQLSSAGLKEFYASFYLMQNIITFGIQLFLTARIQRRFGARIALLFEPVVGIVGGLLYVFRPALPVIRWHKILENATDYSIQSNTKELLYLPVTRVEKYGAKAFNDTFVVRGGDALAALMIFGATSPFMQALGELGLQAMIGVNVALGLVWLGVALRIGRMHQRQMKFAATPLC